ncbi:LAQU0S13e02168g1_1 [Lachancea quebecensis]|uniref:ferroxidase n=1 Tax=Lachancea quebecensis TaxID=1654605 RepID=A0A0P1KVJ4_9SACH|nr:LAQU0S13e02168g1_1 [Lachancea quebecensis]
MLRRSIITLGTAVARRHALRPPAACIRAFSRPRMITAMRGFASGPGSTDGHEIPKEVLELSADAYHKSSDSFLDSLQEQLEELSDAYPELLPDVELTQGVMTIEVPAVGTYVVNKQPPNKQIWLSSPVSGPNRFDFYKNRWISLRDGQDLLSLLNLELSGVLPEPVTIEA